MFYVCSFIVSRLLNILSGWNRNRKKIGFTYVLAKSPINYQKLLFPKPPKSDLAGGLEYIQKKHLKGCILKNGAAGKNRTCDPVITNDVLYH